MSGDVVIKDGQTGKVAQVDKEHRLHAFAIARSEASQALIDGDGFTINTGSITLTSDTSSALLHIKNTDSVPWVITRVFSNTEESVDGVGKYTLEMIGNAIDGTLIDSGPDVEASNLNLGSPKVLNGTFKVGVEGSTVVGGDPVINSIVPNTGNRLVISGDPLAVPSGSSSVIRITPPTGNTSMDVQVGFVLYRAVSEETS